MFGVEVEVVVIARLKCWLDGSDSLAEVRCMAPLVVVCGWQMVWGWGGGVMLLVVMAVQT